MSNQELAIKFYFILAVILASIRIIGYLGKKLGQTQVVCEMITGVILGPSLFGLVFPDFYALVFPKQAIPVVYCVSQVGLVLYMFLIGVEFNVDLIKKRLHSALSISLAGIMSPFLLGSILAYFISSDTTLFSDKVLAWEAIVFTGAAMSITSFPMLARIIYEKGLSGTSLGTLVLAAGSIDDVLAWCLLAVATASFSGNHNIAYMAIGGGIIYALVVLLIVKPLLCHLEEKVINDRKISGPILGFILLLVMLSSFYTDYIGIYAVFGAFIMGIAMPRGVISRELERILEPITTNFLLPLFFIYFGLNTKFNLIFSSRMLLITLIAILLACLGKGITCWAVARLNKEKNKEALVIGILMNARGLMELILLNIGLEKGIITQTFYTMMVIMAIVTTVMTSPIFEAIYRNNVVYFKEKVLIRGDGKESLSAYEAP